VRRSELESCVDIRTVLALIPGRGQDEVALHFSETRDFDGAIFQPADEDIGGAKGPLIISERFADGRTLL
jgi:hypothetical protein